MSSHQSPQARIDDVHSDHQLKREFTLWSAFAFAFAFISPIVALYGIFGLAYSTAGPSFWWNFLIVFAGQLLVAMVFAELVSRWPIEGSIYQWSRRLLGQGYGWAAGWFYMWTLVVAMSSVSVFAAGFVANVFGWNLSPAGQALVAWVILVLGTAANIAGRLVLRILMTGSIIAEIVGSIGLGTWLLLFHRANPVSVLTDGFHQPHFLSLSGPFLLTMGLEALERVAAVRPVGYRAPMWEPSWSTPELLAERGFLYDSSLMDADVPYEISVETSAGASSIVEIPIQWALDDWEQYCFVPGVSGEGLIESPAKAQEIWGLELDAMRGVGGCFTLTNHPFLTGRPSRALALERVVEQAVGYGDVWVASMGQIAEHVRGLGLAPRTLSRPVLG